MTDDLILNTLVRLESKMDAIRVDLSSARESMAAMRAKSESTEQRVCLLADGIEKNETRIIRLEGFRAWILGAIAAGSMAGAVVSALISWAVG